MAELFASGRVIDAILVLVALEVGGLALLHAVFGRGPAPRDIWANLAAGALLMLAVRAALVNAAWPWIALPLLGALVAHLLDLSGRFAATARPDAPSIPRSR